MWNTQHGKERASDRKKKLNALRAELRDALVPSIIRVDWVTREIERFLAQWGNKPAIRPLIAQQLARHLVSKWPFASTQSVEPSIKTEIHAVLKQGDITPAVAQQIAERLTAKWRFASINAIEQLIENRPELLDQVVMASFRDEMHRLMPALPQSKQKRAKPSSDEERARRRARAKRRYDRYPSLRSAFLKASFSVRGRSFWLRRCFAPAAATSAEAASAESFCFSFKTFALSGRGAGGAGSASICDLMSSGASVSRVNPSLGMPSWGMWCQ